MPMVKKKFENLAKHIKTQSYERVSNLNDSLSVRKKGGRCVHFHDMVKN